MKKSQLIPGARGLSRLVLIVLSPRLVFGFVFVCACAVGQTPQLDKTFRQGTQALRDGQLDEAAADFGAVVSASPSFAEAHFNLGLVRLQQGKFDEAVASISKSLALRQTLRGANLFLGIAQYRNSDFNHAKQSLTREARLDPKSADAFLWLGVVELAQDDPTGAVASLDKAAALRPKDVDILYHRGRAHMLVSMQDYQNMYELAPDSWRVHQVLAQSYVEAGRLDEAAVLARRALVVFERALGAEHPNTKRTAGLVATIERAIAKRDG